MTDKQIILITGATGNLGRAVAEMANQQGYRRALMGHRQEKMIELYDESTDSQLLLANVDVTDEKRVNEAVEGVVDYFGRIDFLVDTVGAFVGGTPVAETNDEIWQRAMNGNAWSAFLCSRAVLRHMQEQGFGRIVNIAARQALKASPKLAAYSAAKSALLRMTESIAAEYAEHGIRANCVVPGVIDTPQNREAMPEADFSQWTTPKAIAGVIAFLLSDAATPINGAAIPVDSPA